MSDMLAEMFRRQAKLQRVMRPKREFPSADETELMAQVREQTLSLIAEIIEALEKTAWKPWLTEMPHNPLPYTPFFKEMVDALHFFINLCLLAGITPENLYAGYIRKNEINHMRQRNGYDGRSTKCPGCNDALDDSTGCHYEAEGIWCATKQDWYRPNGTPVPLALPDGDIK